MMQKIKPVFYLLIIFCLTAAGCTSKQLKAFGSSAGASYHCQQDNANRPDAAQREAECNQRQISRRGSDGDTVE